MKRDITTIYKAIFKDGTEVTKTDRDSFRNRLDFYNWICKNRLGKRHGELLQIEERTI